MDEITQERMDSWDKRLECGLDGGDVADVLGDWATDIDRYEKLLTETAVKYGKSVLLVNDQNVLLMALGEKTKFLEGVIDKLSNLMNAEEYLREIDYYKKIEAKVDDRCKEIKALQERDKFLIALEAAGVDNWSGYSYAFEILEEME